MIASRNELFITFSFYANSDALYRIFDREKRKGS